MAAGEAIPTAVAAGLGGLAGVALGGAALPAAALGATALGAAELGTSLYNLAAPKLNMHPMRTPIQAFQETFTPSYMPKTGAERVEAGLVGGALGGLTQARGANALLRYLTPETRGARMAEGFAAGPVAQTAAGAVGGAAPEYYSEIAKGENPYFQFGLGMLGGAAGGRLAGGVERMISRGAPTMEQNIASAAKSLQQDASTLRKEAYTSGGAYDPQKINNLVDSTVSDFQSLYKWDPTKQARFGEINKVMSDLTNAKNKTATMSDIHGLRQDAGAIFQNKNASELERRMAHDVIDRIDTFRNEPLNAVLGKELNVAKGTDKLTKSMAADALLFRNQDVQTAMTTAQNAPNFAKGVRESFGELKNHLSINLFRLTSKK